MPRPSDLLDPTKNYMCILLNLSIGLLIVLAFISTVGSTTPDILFYNGEKLLLKTEPLCSLYLQLSGISEYQESCCADDKARGYVATWEIVNGALYLVDIDTNGTVNWMTMPRLDLAAWDGGQAAVPATWVSGTLHACREGEAMEYISMRNESAYTEDLLFKIEKGELVYMEIILSKVEEEREKLTRINPLSRIWVLVSSLTMVALVLMYGE